MKWGWRRGSEGRQADDARREPAAGQSSPILERVLEGLARVERASVLDLGPLCGETVVFLADRGARVTVEEFSLPDPPSAESSSEDPSTETLVPLRLDQPDEAFQLVLAWEHVDFVPPARLAAFCAELKRVLAPAGRLWLFSLNRRSEGEGPPRPGRFRLLDDQRYQWEAASGERLERWVHPTRDIERALEPLSIQKLHLQRNQMREFLAAKRPTKG